MPEQVSDNGYVRVPPNDRDAEQAVLSAMLFDKEGTRIGVENLKKEDFYSEANGIIFDAIQQLFERGEGADFVTVKNKLTEMGVFENVGGSEYLTSIVLINPGTSANAKQYCDIVKSKSQYRSLIKLAGKMQKDAYEASAGVEEIMGEAEQGLFKLSENISSEDFTPMHVAVARTIEKIELANKSQNHITGLSTGFIEFDKKTAGLQPSDLILIAARPSMGKTAFALNIAQYIGTKLNKTVAIFSLEMSQIQLTNRMLSVQSGVEAEKLRSGGLTPDDCERLAEAMGILSDSKIFINDRSNVSPGELRAECAKLQLEHGLDLIVIDYLQLMNSGSRRVESTQAEVAYISKSLKSIAREFNVPVIALSQLSRKVESRENKKPMLSDLRESGSIEQDADVVCFLYREEYYSENKDEASKDADVIIAKQRNGALGTVTLTWQGKYTRFANKEYVYSDTEISE
ncbi:MAG: replicative DNA helicase [Firmicutes bacterium]|nr:replicative DNA helicase [Bacillota bacterium]